MVVGYVASSVVFVARGITGSDAAKPAHFSQKIGKLHITCNSAPSCLHPWHFFEEWPDGSFAIRPIYGKHHVKKSSGKQRKNPLRNPKKLMKKTFTAYTQLYLMLLTLLLPYLAVRSSPIALIAIWRKGRLCCPFSVRVCGC